MTSLYFRHERYSRPPPPHPSKEIQFPYSRLRQHTNSFHLGPVMRVTVTELMWNIEITIMLFSPEFSLNVSC